MPIAQVDHVGVGNRGVLPKNRGMALTAAIDRVVRAVGRIVLRGRGDEDRIDSTSSLKPQPRARPGRSGQRVGAGRIAGQAEPVGTGHPA